MTQQNGGRDEKAAGGVPNTGDGTGGNVGTGGTSGTRASGGGITGGVTDTGDGTGGTLGTKTGQGKSDKVVEGMSKAGKNPTASDEKGSG